MPSRPRPLTRALIGSCTSGLGNRLLMLAGATRLAARSGRRFFLYWPANENVGCHLGELFVHAYTLVEAGDLDRWLLNCTKLKVYNAGFGERGESYECVAPDGDPHIDVVLLKCWHYPRFRGEAESGGFFSELRESLQLLRLVPELASEVNNFPLPEKVVGVHIRRADDRERFGVSRDRDFQSLMRLLLEHQPGVSFFLATDCRETECRFVDEFGPAIVTCRKNWAPRASVTGTREAVVDLWLLSRTAALVGNIGSSFTRTAGLLGNLPVVCATAGTAGVNWEASMETLLKGLDPERGVSARSRRSGAGQGPARI